MEQIAAWVVDVLHNIDDADLHHHIADDVRELCAGFPVPGQARYRADEGDSDAAQHSVPERESNVVSSPT
jgi:hypothetical protein